MYDEKREYLIKTFSRTKRKDYENYILTAIWHRIHNNNIQPVTQQYIKLNNGKYALIDLYFPQIYIGVECDEAYHLMNQKADAFRELSIEDKLSSIIETDNFELHHIHAYESLENIEKQIDSVVEIIKERINKINIEAWTGKNNSIHLAIDKGIISVKDNFTFKTIVEICECFNKKVNGMQHSFFPISDNYQIWCPKLSNIKNGVPESVASGWTNILSDDWNAIMESNYDINKINPMGKLAHSEKYRITFGKRKDILGRNVYRFLGVFKFDKMVNNTNYYKRVAENIDLNLTE